MENTAWVRISHLYVAKIVDSGSQVYQRHPVTSAGYSYICLADDWTGKTKVSALVPLQQTPPSFPGLRVYEPRRFYVPMECDRSSAKESCEGTLKRHVLRAVLGIFICSGAPLSASGTIVASFMPPQVADSLPFTALIGLIALGAILVFRKMIRDLF